MKKLLLLLIAVTALSCSGDDSTTQTNNNEGTVTIEYDSEHCGISCIKRYKVVNTYEDWVSYDIKYTFLNPDSHHNNETTYIFESGSSEFEEYFVVVETDRDNEVVSAEIINLEVL